MPVSNASADQSPTVSKHRFRRISPKVGNKFPRGSWLLLLLVFAAAGCSRNFWRTQADFDAYHELLKKTTDARWDVPRLTLLPDERSRLFDPYDPDRPPLPPDDPSAAEFMRVTSGYDGYKSWHKFGQTFSVENPQWLANFGLKPEVAPGLIPRVVPVIDNSGAAKWKQCAELLAGTDTDLDELLSVVMCPSRRYRSGSGDDAARIRRDPFAENSPEDDAVTVRLASWTATNADRHDDESAAVIAGEEEPRGNVVIATADRDASEAQPILSPAPEPGPIERGAEIPLPPTTIPQKAGFGTYDANAAVTTQRLVPTLEKLTLAQAIELANINSREYQTAIETAYASALQLSFQQFQFNVRYLGLGGREPTASVLGSTSPGAFDRLNPTGRVGISQLLPTGGQWILEMTNNTLWIFSGQGNSSSASLLSYSLVQPLLLNAGRKVVLENLTRQERQLLYDIRTLARFRKIFFGNTVVNGGSGGYMGLLRQYQQILNQRENIQSLLVQLARSKALANPPKKFVQDLLPELPADLQLPEDLKGRVSYDASAGVLVWTGEMSTANRDRLAAASADLEWQRSVADLYAATQTETITLEVAQLLSRLATSQNALRTAERLYQDNLDDFKFEMGVPTDFQLTIDLGLLKPFELIDPRLSQLERQVSLFITELAQLDEDTPNVDQFLAIVERFNQLTQAVEDNGFNVVLPDFDRVEAVKEQRLTTFDTDQQRQSFLQYVDRDRRLYAELQADWAVVKRNLRKLSGRFAEDEWKTAVNLLRGSWDDTLQVTQNLKVIQLGLRVELITLPEFTMPFDEVQMIAVENRLDLMNQRAAVMDARRVMEVAANRLQSQVDLVATGNIGTAPGNRPFDVRGDRSTFQMGVQVTAPLDQITERNTYRQSLINYQQAKRAYMAAEDNVKNDVRTEWRFLTVLRQNFETARLNFRISAIQLDLAIENANAPVAAAQSGTAGRTTGGAGNQGLNLLNALQSILNAQNELINTWVQYEQNRINIYRDMDIMQVDERGVWDDPVYRERVPLIPSVDSLPNFTPEMLLPPPAGPDNLPISLQSTDLLPDDLFSSELQTSASGDVAPNSGAVRLPNMNDAENERSASRRYGLRQPAVDNR